MKVRYGWRAVLLADRNQQTATGEKNKQTENDGEKQTIRKQTEMKVRYGWRAVQLADHNQQTAACKKKKQKTILKQTDASCKKKKERLKT